MIPTDLLLELGGFLVNLKAYQVFDFFFVIILSPGRLDNVVFFYLAIEDFQDFFLWYVDFSKLPKAR